MSKQATLEALRAAVESTSIHHDGTVWGGVYLPNAGSGHAFAGYLSALTADGDYRPTGDQFFGRVRMPAPAASGVPAIKAAIAKGDRRAAIRACNELYRSKNARA